MPEPISCEAVTAKIDLMRHHTAGSKPLEQCIVRRIDVLHMLEHRGEFFKVRGPLNVARPPQGHPVLVQAGSSGDGQDFAEVWILTSDRFDLAKTFRTGVQAGSGKITVRLIPDPDHPESVALLIIYSGDSLEWLVKPNLQAF